MVLVGLGLLILLAPVIIMITVFVLEVLGIILGVFLVLGGVAAIVFGSRWSRRRRADWGQSPATT